MDVGHGCTAAAADASHAGGNHGWLRRQNAAATAGPVTAERLQLAASAEATAVEIAGHGWMLGRAEMASKALQAAGGCAPSSIYPRGR